MKLIIFVVGLGLGFGGGVLFSSHNPNEAATIANQEDKKLLEAQIKFTQASKDMADQYIAKHPGESDAKMIAVRDSSQQRLDELNKKLDALK